MKALATISFVLVALAAGRAEAYPQFELSKDQSCSGCHLSPTGGGLLSENGIAVAESVSKYGTAPELMYGAVKPPDWLAVGGDFRYAYGYLQAPQRYLLGFPMQGDLYAAATKDSFSVHVTVGFRPAQEGNEGLTRVWSREHYAMWHSEPGAATGIFARVGRFMPVFGLRLAEHTVYTRRFGGTPLYADTYAASVTQITDAYQVHVTGFIEDPLIDPVQLSNGGAVYGEYRLNERTSIGAGGMVAVSDWDRKYRGTLTAKHYLPGPDLLLSGELQLVNPHVGDYAYRQLVGYAMATWFPGDGFMIDLGYGKFDENLRIKNLDRDAIDLNVHWFATSHIELVLISRAEFIGGGQGGPTGAYSMLMGHYRL